MKLSGLLLLLFAVSGASAASAAEPPNCAAGAYRSPNGELAAVIRRPDQTRYAFLTGPTGRLDSPDSLLSCRDGRLTDRDGREWTRLGFRSKSVDFFSHGVRLHGVLLLPPETGPKPPLVVLVHGSEHTSPNGSGYQSLFTAQGVATFAYDKRGTGQSEGEYTQDFDLLADDAAAAVEAARRACPGCFSRVGLHGGSQGGWVAPLAAARSKADFVEVSFGVIGTPLEQDQWQVDYQLEELGFSPGPAVHAVTDATAKIMGSDFKAGQAELDTLKRRYGKEPWFSRLDGQYTGELVRGEVDRARWESPHVPWFYDSEAVLRGLKIPQLWVFAQDDSVAPSANSIARLEKLRREGVDATIVVYPHTDHGITTFVSEAPGKRRTTGLARGYLPLIADWAKGGLKPPYGDAAWLATGRTPGH